MKSLFVTGGAGFIGSEFLRAAAKRDPIAKIINFDALTYAGNLENVFDLEEPRHIFVHGNICNRAAVLKHLPDNCDGIINFAAESHVDRSIESAHNFVLTNVLGTQVLLDCAREKKVKRFLQISTDEVMGNLSETGDDLFTEESPFAPNSPYSASKAAAEHFVRASFKTFGQETLIARCGNNYGYRQHPEKLIPKIILNALVDASIPIYGDGKNVRDWIFVTDCCKAIWKVFTEGKPGETYNIGARNTRTNNDVVKSILEIMEKPNSLINYVDDRLGHDRRYEIDPSKVENDLDWRAVTDWKTGLKQTVDWYQNNPAWIESTFKRSRS